MFVWPTILFVLGFAFGGVQLGIGTAAAVIVAVLFVGEEAVFLLIRRRQRLSGTRNDVP